MNPCRAVVLVTLGIAVTFALRMTRAPEPRSPVSLADFSLDRAAAHVRAMAVEPHPTGSAANERVRGYLMDQLGRLDLHPRVQTANVTRYGGEMRTVNNIIARLPAAPSADRDARSAIMLVAHYDSVPHGPGAADDTAAVAALLETFRALRAGPPLRQDVVLLITDGEELGLLGARAFVAEMPEAAAEIALVLNFDARGTTGPSLMFETAPHNGSLIGHFAAADPFPLANSLSYDVYRLLRNDTDFTIFRRAGLKGLNFAFMGNYFYYHKAADNPDHLDPASLYHHGAHALALTRHFASLDSRELAAINAEDQPNAVYFNLTPSLLVRYPATWIWPLSAAAFLLMVVALILLFRRRQLTPRGLAGAFARLTLGLLVVSASVYGLILLFRPPQSPAAFTLQLLAIMTVSAVITLAMALEFRRRTTLADIAMAGVILFSALAIPMNIYLPGGSYLFLWPPLFVSLGLLTSLLLPSRPRLQSLISIVAFMPAVLLLAPLNVQLFTALTLNLAPACSVIVVLTTWLILSGAVSGDVKPLPAPGTPGTLPASTRLFPCEPPDLAGN
jgi:hypothetical protein